MKNKKKKKKKRKKQIIIRKKEKEEKDKSKEIVVYHGANQGGDMESNKGCPNIELKKSSDIFFNQQFLQQTSLLGIDSVLKFAPNEWLHYSNEIDHPFQNKLTYAKNNAIEQVLDYHNHKLKKKQINKNRY